MPVVVDVDTNDLIEGIAIELKKINTIKPPSWAMFVKTGVHKERPPARDDWWYVRAASILRAVDKLGPIGVQKLRIKYGGREHRGHQPERFYKGSGSIIRKALQQLEAAGLIKKAEKDVHKGRIITPQGVKLINRAVAEARKIEEERKKRKEQRKQIVEEKKEAKQQKVQPTQQDEQKPQKAQKAEVATEAIKE